MSDHVERTGLYIMVFIAMLSTCSVEEKVDKILDKLESSPQIESTVDKGQTDDTLEPQSNASQGQR